MAYTSYSHHICLLPEHHVIYFLRKQYVRCVLDHVPFVVWCGVVWCGVVWCVMQKTTRTILSTEKTEAWHYPDILLSLISFRAEVVSHAVHAPGINALLFILDYADTLQIQPWNAAVGFLLNSKTSAGV